MPRIIRGPPNRHRVPTKIRFWNNIAGIVVLAYRRGIGDEAIVGEGSGMGNWTFLTKHARALLFIAEQPDARLRDLAAALDITERSAYAIVADLTEAGYVVKERDGRRNRYHIQEHLPIRDAISRERTIGEVLDLLGDSKRRRRPTARRG